MNTTTEPPKYKDLEGCTVELRLEHALRIIADQHAQLQTKTQLPTSQPQSRTMPPAVSPAPPDESVIAQYQKLKSREDKGEEPQGTAFKFFRANTVAIRKEQSARRKSESERCAA